MCVIISEKLLTGADVRIPIFVNYLFNILVFFWYYFGNVLFIWGAPWAPEGLSFASLRNPFGSLGLTWASLALPHGWVSLALPLLPPRATVLGE